MGGGASCESLELLPAPSTPPSKGTHNPPSAPETWQFISVSGSPVSTESVQEGWQQLAQRGRASAPRVQLPPRPPPPARPDRTPESEVTLG